MGYRTGLRTAAATAVLAAVMLLVPGTGLSANPSIAVFPMKNNGQTQYDGFSSGLAVMFTTNLKESDKLDVIEPQRVYDAMKRFRMTGGAPAVSDALKAARELGADYALTGEFLMFGGRFRIDVQVYDVASGTIHRSGKAQDKEDKLFDKVDSLSDEIIVDLTGSLPSQKGLMVIQSIPDGATVTIDGEEAGETPLTLKDKPQGSYEVTIELYGYKPRTETVVVREGETAELTVELEPLHGGVRVWWQELPTSDVSIGSETIGMAAFQNYPLAMYCRNLPVGDYTVTVRMPYKEEGSWENKATTKTFSTDFTLSPGEVVDVFIDNNVFGPSVEVSPCSECDKSWDFDADIVWYEPK